MTRTILLATLAACSGPPKDGSTTPTVDGDADTDADTDTDTDTDADTDSGTDSGTTPTDTATGTGDTGLSSSGWGGDYVGSIKGSITYQATPSGPTLLLDCSGTVDVVVDDAATPRIQGTGSCAPAYGTDVFAVVLVGDLTTDPDAGGDLTLTHPTVTIDDGWDGGFSGDTLTGSADGQTVGFPSTVWSVAFSADR